MRSARSYLVNGRVQGVGFRYFVYEAASREGLHGWVRNLPDGRVEILAEGDFEALLRFEQRVRQGPRASYVEQVDVVDMDITGFDSGFNIR